MKPPKSLPWMMYDAPEDGEFGAEYEVGATFGSKKDRAENAAYIVHAANAYPALVEALQQALRWDHDCHWMKTVGKVCERCGDDGETGNDVVPGQAEAARARSLLQELGEGE